MALHQRLVQRQLAPKGVRDADLLANHVVADIGEMEIVAERIQSAVRDCQPLPTLLFAINEKKGPKARRKLDANPCLALKKNQVNTTLSLQQSEMAIDQGKILMVFTFATILFVSSVLCARGKVGVYGVLIRTFSASLVVPHIPVCPGCRILSECASLGTRCHL